MRTLVHESKRDSYNEPSISFYCNYASLSLIFPDDIHIEGVFGVEFLIVEQYKPWARLLLFILICSICRSRNRNGRRNGQGFECNPCALALIRFVVNVFMFVPRKTIICVRKARISLKLRKFKKVRERFYQEVIKSTVYKQGEMQFQQDSCSICLEKFRPDEPAFALSCDHIFHASCLFNWFRDRNLQNMNCPFCNSNILDRHTHAAIELQDLGSEVQAQFIKEKLKQAADSIPQVELSSVSRLDSTNQIEEPHPDPLQNEGIVNLEANQANDGQETEAGGDLNSQNDRTFEE